MATATATVPADAPVYHFSVEQFDRLVGAGVITEDDRVEFIEGVLVPKMSRNPPHDSTLDRLEDIVRELVPSGWRVRAQKATTFLDGRPEPDIAVVLGPAGRYNDHHPTPAEIAFVAEVADTSLATDRGRKYRSYSRAGIPVYWVVNLPDRVVEVYTDPEYLSEATFGSGQAVALAIAGAVVGDVSVDAILP